MNETNKAEAMYLDYFNNYLTLKRFAEDYNISEEKALLVIARGRKINHSR